MTDDELLRAYYDREPTPNEAFHVKYGQAEALRRVEAAVRAAVVAEVQALDPRALASASIELRLLAGAQAASADTATVRAVRDAIADKLRAP